MDKEIIRILENNTICCLSMARSDGSPHSAVMHYSVKNNPLTLFFSTSKTSRKCQKLASEQTVKASVVIGFLDDTNTLQIDGNIRQIVDPREITSVSQAHYQKNPGSAEFKDDPDTIFLAFTPTWWRYTDYNTNPVTIISSESR